MTISFDTSRLTDTEQIVFEALSYGEENAAKSADLKVLTGLDTRSLRAVVERIRRKGLIICSGNRGYYLPATLDELQRHNARQRRLARSVLYTLRGSRQLEREWKLQEEFAPQSRLDEGVSK